MTLVKDNKKEQQQTVVVTGSDDGHVRLFDADTLRLQKVVDINAAVWCVIGIPSMDNNVLAVGHAHGMTMIKLD
jgi:hypothetical protein